MARPLVPTGRNLAMPVTDGLPPAGFMGSGGIPGRSGCLASFRPSLTRSPRHLPGSRQNSLPVVYCAKRTLSFNVASGPSVTRFRVSDEGGFWASTAVRPRAARQPRERQKPTEVGEAAEPPNHDKTPMDKGRLGSEGYPRRGEGCGDTLDWVRQ